MVKLSDDIQAKRRNGLMRRVEELGYGKVTLGISFVGNRMSPVAPVVYSNAIA